MTAYSTLEEFIASSRSTQISYANLSFIDELEGIKFPILNVIDDYINEIKSYSFQVTLSDTEYRKYKYRPKLLANDVYDNGEYYFVILAINGICNVKDFTLRTLNLLRKEDMITVLSRIYNAEKNNISNYNNT